MTSRQASFHQQGIAGVLLAPLKGLCISLLILLGLLLAAWIVNGLFVFRVWPDGIARLQHILDQDIARTYYIECWFDDLPGLTSATANLLYDVLFRMSGIHEMGLRFAEGHARSIPDTIVRNAYADNFTAIQVAMVATQLFGVRLATLGVGLPLYVLLYAVALADGLVQRAVRRTSGGRESASLYHRAKHLQRIILVAAAAASLLSPVSIDNRFVWVPGLVVVAILVRIQWVYYKKHI